MIVKEYGKSNEDIIMLLHGGGLSWWNYEEVSEILKSNYHVILPILDGHQEVIEILLLLKVMQMK